MALPYVFLAPDDKNGFADWLFWHKVDHQDVVDALRLPPFNFRDLPTYPLDIMLTLRDKNWLKAHANIHSVINEVLGTGEGSDLEAVDLTKPREREAWYDLNYQEHRSWRTLLGI
jgi:hypothetical protein